MSRRTFQEVLVLLSSIFFTISLEAFFEFMTNFYWNIWYIAFQLYLIVMIWAIYAYICYEVPAELQINPLQFFLLPVIPFFFLLKHLARSTNKTYYRPAIDLFFLLSFLFLSLAFRLETSEFKEGITNDFVPYTILTITGMGVFLLYLSLEDWDKIALNDNLKRSLGGLALILGVFIFYSMFGMKPTFYWNSLIRFGVFGFYAALLIRWAIKVRNDIKIVEFRRRKWFD